MKAFIVTLLTLSLLILTTNAVRAETGSYQQVEQTYLSRLDTYRTNLQDYQTARQKYLDFGTLTAETAAVRAGSVYLNSSLNLIQGYLEIISNKASTTSGLSSGDQDFINNFYQQETTYINQMKANINSISAQSELVTLSTSLNDHITNETLTKIPLTRSIIVSSDYREYLDRLTNSWETAKTLLTEQTFLGGPTQELVNGWLSDTEGKIGDSNNLLKTITLDIREYKDDVKEKRKSLNDINERLKLLKENLVSHGNNLLEILGRLRHD